MTYIKGTIAVVLGYLIMTFTSMGVVGRLFADAQAPPETKQMIMSFGALAIGAFIGGFLATLIVGSANSPAIYIAIGAVAVVHGRSLVTGAGVEPDWYIIVSVIALAIGFLVGASTAAYKLDRR